MTTIADRIDDALLGAAQRVSDAVDRTFGLDHWATATGFLRMGLGAIMLTTALSITHSGMGFLWSSVTAILSFLWFFVYQMLSDQLRRQRSSRDAGRALRVSEARTRRMDLLVAIFICAIQTQEIDAQEISFMVGVVCFHLHYYFKAASLPPPSTSNRPAWSV